MALLKRKWLIDNQEYLLKEIEYYRDHHDLMELAKKILWKLGDEKGYAKIEITRR